MAELRTRNAPVPVTVAKPRFAKLLPMQAVDHEANVACIRCADRLTVGKVLAIRYRWIPTSLGALFPWIFEFRDLIRAHLFLRCVVGTQEIAYPPQSRVGCRLITPCAFLLCQK